MSGISEDVTPQKLELQRLTEASRLLSVGELASGVAHEINNPLTVIKLSSEALKESNLPESAVHDLEIISNQTERIADIVGEMGFLSRRSPMIISNISATEFLERCLALKKHDFRINNISVASQVQTGLQEINIDERLMTQVMVNIFTNAEQACNSANGRGHISVTVRKSEGLIKFAISDDGPGIPSEILSQVFDPFFTTKDKAGGTGLGLSVSYSIVAQLGGNLWAESNGVSGTTFHIDIPAASHDQVDALAEPLSRGDQASQTQRAGRILVVDDEPDLRRILVRVLEGDSYIVDQATEGEEAWDMLKEQEYDCILLDLRMAGISGQELFQRISSSDSSQAEKVVFLTGDGGNPSTNMFLESLHNTVLEKPVSIDQLKRTLRESIK